MVNSVTAILEYAMQLVDDLLTDMEKYLWCCSLDAANGFWAVTMTQRARKISAFVCALGHFEWLRMPFGLKNAPMIYQWMIDNALWGFVQPRGGWSAIAERVRMAEAADAAVGGSPTDAAIHGRTRFEADRESSDIPDSLSAVVNDPRGDMFVSGEADQSSLVDSAFAQLLHSTITNFVGLDKALQRVAPPSKRTPMVRVDPELLYTRLQNDHRCFVLSFDGSAKTPKHGGCGSCAWILWRLPDWKIEIVASAYLESTTVNQAEYMGMNEDLRAAQAYGATDLVVVGDSRLAIQQSLGVIACLMESLLTQLNIHRELVARFQSVRYVHVTREYNASVDSLAGETLAAMEAKTTLTEESKNKLEQLNRIHEVIYERPNQEVSQVSTLRTLSEDMVTQRGTFFDFALKPRFMTAITRQQTQAAKKRVKFADTHDEDSEALPVEPESPDRPNDATTEPSHVENGEIFPGAAERPPSAEDVDPLEVQKERRRKVGRALDEELRWANLKLVLKGESASLGYKAARDAWKMADRFVLSEDGLLCFLGENRRWGKDRMNETILRLVVPTTMVQEVLQNCHDSLEGGHQGIVRTFHRVKADYYWFGLYADVERHVRSCPDCSSSKSRPQLRGYSPGNILAERPLQIVSMDFVIPLPKSRMGSTALLLFQCAFTGFVMAKSGTSALCVAQAFEECVYRRFGAPSLVGHDRDPRFMSDVFQAFAEMMQSRSRATLSYRPQANGQQECSVKTVMQSVRVYAEDPLQHDWDEIVERLVFAINNSEDTTRKETPFYLVHGWDAQSTLKAIASSLKRGFGKQSDALAWRREVNRQQEIALKMGKEVNESSEGNPEDAEDTSTPVSESPKSLFEPGDRVWLYMERVKPGLTKKLAHRWHGPFRVKRKVEEYAYELELPDISGYRFYPVVHVSRLKPVKELGGRPKVPLTRELTDEARLVFDEELLPEDSWEPDSLAGDYEVESILDDRRPIERRVLGGRSERVGYDEPTWEPMTNLSCGGLLYDYLCEKRSSQRFQMVQVADEDSEPARKMDCGRGCAACPAEEATVR
ncbi:unnamed protein product [Phytophthora fragariaefolia]|uniref:Unnamed protein product n=1 Tax=Phytophthora fragariaefolia TaxID=1490495 RepID=A0A9W7CLQ0_9STRA|nr:unnamed protein product [Phytophthora fragariaefolia]